MDRPNDRHGADEPVIDLTEIGAVVFDTDGVITDTARGHAAAWKHVFDAFLRGRSAPFDIREDYLRHVDGRPRLDGIRTFLAARGLTLPEGTPDDEPGAPTVHGLGLAKDRIFVDQVDKYGVAAFPSTVGLLHELRRRGARTAAVSSSRHGRKLVNSAGVSHLLDLLVDGNDAALMNLPGKPDPALFLEAARRLALPATKVAVVEGTLPGIEAARKGGFGLVIAVARDGGVPAPGADVVVADLGELSVRNRVLPLRP
ncbi:haloacid dehalogenase superfamily, subfamily IA, variant 3 with third motif having DD or ED [Nonomuraea jiangxiensis]|uniref:Haloacid dehalogenase superfamily, subfamily IA, variant 3 with third motif having DD or ED n=1 Tax=Nonomuraea jiangxiensis TaxID=633440 RepID=A0A1G9V0F6_9ACTN|nr:haloacid dehalogenase superfamily, subfamily IA, variant 3 with third motif having DD or ED [Nonomuraea jiangxiensis]